MLNKHKYEARISCHNNASARFEFEADSAKLAKDHAYHLVSDYSIVKSFKWDKFPNDIFYIEYRRIGTDTWKYAYAPQYGGKAIIKEPEPHELITRYWEYDNLIEDNIRLAEALELMYNSVNPKNVQRDYMFGDKVLQEYYCGSKGTPSDEALVKAKEALSKHNPLK